jgi:hypothetical protein
VPTGRARRTVSSRDRPASRLTGAASYSGARAVLSWMTGSVLRARNSFFFFYLSEAIHPAVTGE